MCPRLKADPEVAGIGVRDVEFALVGSSIYISNQLSDEL